MLESSYCLNNICLSAQNCMYEDGNLMQKVDLSSYEYEKLKFCQVLTYLLNADEFNVFLILNFRRVLYVVCFLLGNSPASKFYVPTFRNTLFHLHRQVRE
jgi:hypothetical protein